MKLNKQNEEELQGLVDSLTASLETMRQDEFGSKSFHQEATEAALKKAKTDLKKYNPANGKFCPKCNSQLYNPPTHYPDGQPVGGGDGYVYWCLGCQKALFADEAVTVRKEG